MGERQESVSIPKCLQVIAITQDRCLDHLLAGTLHHLPTNPERGVNRFPTNRVHKFDFLEIDT